MEFADWLTAPKPKEQRMGQHLFNTAPEAIYRYCYRDLLLDCFYEKDPVEAHKVYGPITNRFITFCCLVWDDQDEETFKTARLMIWRET